MATPKVISLQSGVHTEVASINTSAGVGDAEKLVATNASGFVDPSFLNVKSTSAGAGDAGKVVVLDSAGKLDSSMMPTGIGEDSLNIVASEALTGGDFINVWNNAGTANVRKADAASAGKEAHGFVLTSYAQSASAKVYFEGTNTACSGLTPGVQFLSSTTAGKTASAPPTGTGKVCQRVGLALSATSINFEGGIPVTLA